MGGWTMSQQNSKFRYNSRCARRPRNRTGCSDPHSSPGRAVGVGCVKGKLKVALQLPGLPLQRPLAAALGSVGSAPFHRPLEPWEWGGVHASSKLAGGQVSVTDSDRGPGLRWSHVPRGLWGRPSRKQSKADFSSLQDPAYFNIKCSPNPVSSRNS